jgi:hypothetical protein
MKQSVALITLGAANYERAGTFYDLERQRGAAFAQRSVVDRLV